MTALLTAEGLNPNQVARRSRVLEAAVDLAVEGGYDAVQMRDVAARAQVALGTIYRYFASKDHLLAECLLETWRGMSERLEQRPLEGTTASERVIDLVRRLMRRVADRPELTAALVTASSSPDPAVRDCQREQVALQSAVFVGAMEDLDPDRAEEIARTLRLVWFATLLGWVNGWHDLDSVGLEFEAAVHLLLDAR